MIHEQMNLLNEQLEQYDPFGYCNHRQLRKSNETTISSPSSSSSAATTVIVGKIFEGVGGASSSDVNLFVFEYRDYKLDCFVPRVIYTHPLSSNSLVQKFINDIGELMLDNIAGCRNVKPYLIERSSLMAIHNNNINSHYDCFYSSNEPLDLYILSISLMDSTPQIQFRMMSTIIGRYLRKSYVDDLITEDLCIDDIRFGFWSRNESTKRLLSLNLLVENCLRIKWNLNDTRILYSKYFHLIDLSDHQNHRNEQQNQQILPTTGSLYPQIFYRHFKFYWQQQQQQQQQFSNNVQTIQNEQMEQHLPQKEFFRIIWDHFQPTNLRSIELIDKKFISLNSICYCYRFIIQSVDLAMDRQKIDDLITTLGLRLKAQFSQIKIHQNHRR
nr:uncharacterized protein LOC124490538 [Dermatophagoides farinae]